MLRLDSLLVSSSRSSTRSLRFLSGRACNVWTWAATILQSSNFAWQYGISGPFWYAGGASIQVLLFGVMAIEIKRKAPYAHTVCEIVKARRGTAAHVVFLFFCFMTNIIVTAMLLLGGSAVVNALTGVIIYAASFLIPLEVIVYTLAGGLKATFLASYIHSVIVHVVLVIFVYLVYAGSGELGSPSIVYNRLLEVSSKSRVCHEPISHGDQPCGPVGGNYHGSYLTMLSSGGLVFGIINIVGNFDTGYWVSAIAARPSSTHKGYLLGGLVWFAVPFSLATSLGLGALALDLPITTSEASHRLVPAATAIALMGKAGSVLLLTMLFMAVTSAGSSELIAISSLCTYDIYRTYINPNATGKKILRVSRAVVLGFGCFMGMLVVILNKVGVSLGWMYLAMGVFIGSAVLPIAFMLLWRKANAIGAILGTIIGCILGVTTWLSVTKIEYGRPCMLESTSIILQDTSLGVLVQSLYLTCLVCLHFLRLITLRTQGFRSVNEVRTDYLAASSTTEQVYSAIIDHTIAEKERSPTVVARCVTFETLPFKIQAQEEPPASTFRPRAHPLFQYRHYSLMEGELVGPFNLGNPGEFTMLELAKACRCDE
ncbi:hypothetical protein ACFE04_002552 [Oxalis oulophora]